MQKVELNGKTILVTGAAGFIGSNLVKRLLKEVNEATIIGIDNMNDYYDVSLKEWRLKELNQLSLHSPLSTLHSPLSTLHSPLFTLHSPLSTLYRVTSPINPPSIISSSNTILQWSSTLPHRQVSAIPSPILMLISSQT